MTVDEVRKMAQERREKACFGCTIEDLKSGCFMTNFEDPQDLIMLSMSIQSDCQELLAMGGNADETIRQYLNRSKWAAAEASRLINKLLK